MSNFERNSFRRQQRQNQDHDSSDDDGGNRESSNSTPAESTGLGLECDNEMPCCSKSITPDSPHPHHHVRFRLSNNGEESSPKSQITPMSPPHNLPSHNHRARSGLALSDTVLILSNSPELERAPTFKELKFESDAMKDGSSGDVNDMQYNEWGLNDDEAFSVKFSSTRCLWENAGFGVACKSNVPSSISFNNNTMYSPSQVKLLENASYLFHKDRVEQVKRTLDLLPRGREFVVFNVFTDLARAFGYGRRRRKKHVAFPEEVLSQYEQKGDVAGKDRFVPSAKQPYKGLSASSKKRKLSAVYSSWTVKESEFVPRVERIDDYSKLEYFCERKCIACECCNCCRTGKKPSLVNVMEGFFSDLNLSSLFLHSHATRTFESAMGALEFVRLHSFSLTTMSINKQLMNASYSKQRLGVLSGSIWIFGYCIRIILDMAGSHSESASKLPSEIGFKKVMEQFATICLSIKDSVKIILQYSHNFYHFCKECIRILKVIQVHVGFKTEFNTKKPLKRGDGLDLNRTMKSADIVKQRAVTVMIAKTSSIVENEEDNLEWRQFQDISGNEKIYALRQLLNTSLDGIGLVQTQLRFLIDDIVDSVKDIAEADLLFLLADIYDRVKFLGNVGKKLTKTEMEQIAQLMMDFCKDFQSFADFGQHIIKRFVEFRDIVNVTHEFLVTGLKLDILSEMLPVDMFKKKKRSWCGGGRRNRGKKTKTTASKFYPKYKVQDFFRVYYKEAVHSQIYANKYYFCLGWSLDSLKDVVPRSIQQRWGEGGDILSPRTSLEEYVDPDEVEEEPVIVETIKPILVGNYVSPEASVQNTPGEQGQGGEPQTQAQPAPAQPAQGEAEAGTNVEQPKPKPRFS